MSRGLPALDACLLIATGALAMVYVQVSRDLEATARVMSYHQAVVLPATMHASSVLALVDESLRRRLAREPKAPELWSEAEWSRGQVQRTMAGRPDPADAAQAAIDESLAWIAAHPVPSFADLAGCLAYSQELREQERHLALAWERSRRTLLVRYGVTLREGPRARNTASP